MQENDLMQQQTNKPFPSGDSFLFYVTFDRPKISNEKSSWTQDISLVFVYERSFAWMKFG